jgi:hypothetical protein
MTEKDPRVERLLRQVYAQIHNADEDDFANKQYEFAFHVVETIPDLQGLCELAAAPEMHSLQQCQEILNAVLYHAAGHIVAAARLYDVFIDTFGADQVAPDRRENGA